MWKQTNYSFYFHPAIINFHLMVHCIKMIMACNCSFYLQLILKSRKIIKTMAWKNQNIVINFHDNRFVSLIIRKEKKHTPTQKKSLNNLPLFLFETIFFKTVKINFSFDPINWLWNLSIAIRFLCNKIFFFLPSFMFQFIHYKLHQINTLSIFWLTI